MSHPPPPARIAGRARGPWLRRALAIVVATLGSAVAWALSLPGHEEIQNWFYPVRWRSLDAPATAIALGAAVPVLAWLVLRAAGARRHGLAIVLLLATSLAGQFATLLLVGPELETALGHLEGGHGAFLRAAHDTRERPLLEILRAYPEDAAAGRLGDFAPSKPPGTFAVYRWMYDVGGREPVRSLLAPIARLAEGRSRLRAYPAAAAAGIVLFPLLTALVTLPIVWLGRALSGRAMPGYWAALLWTTCPAVLIVTHHTDGSWYPLLVVTSCAAAAAGARSDRAALSVAGGLVLALAIWSSYGLLPSLGFAAGAQLAVAIGRARRTTPGHAALGYAALGYAALERISGHAARHVGSLGLGLAAGLGALVGSGVFPKPIESYRLAMEYHERWKVGFIGGQWGLTGALEFWAWVGLPLLVLFLVALAGSLRRASERSARAWAALGALVLAVHLTVMLYAGSNESARLWLFQIPIFAVVVAGDLWRASVRSGRGVLIALALAGHLVLVPITRAAQVW